MHRFKNILCIIDPGEKISAVVKRASELAALHGTQLTLAHLSSGPDDVGDLHIGLDKHERSNEGAGTLVSTPLVGDPAEEIVKRVLQSEHDLLMKAVDIPVDGKPVVTNTDKFLLRQCPCPVWLFRPPHNRRREKIMAVVDLDNGEVVENLNELVLDLSSSVASEEFAQWHAVSSWGVSRERAMRSRMSTLAIRRLVAAIRRANMRWLRRLTEPYAKHGNKFRVHLRRGVPNQAILAEAKDRQPDLIVMGTAGRFKVSSFIFGTDAERVLPQVDCSILAVKPKDFTSTLRE